MLLELVPARGLAGLPHAGGAPRRGCHGVGGALGCRVRHLRGLHRSSSKDSANVVRCTTSLRSEVRVGVGDFRTQRTGPSLVVRAQRREDNSPTVLLTGSWGLGENGGLREGEGEKVRISLNSNFTLLWGGRRVHLRRRRPIPSHSHPLTPSPSVDHRTHTALPPLSPWRESSKAAKAMWGIDQSHPIPVRAARALHRFDRHPPFKGFEDRRVEGRRKKRACSCDRIDARRKREHSRKDRASIDRSLRSSKADEKDAFFAPLRSALGLSRQKKKLVEAMGIDPITSSMLRMRSTI